MASQIVISIHDGAARFDRSSGMGAWPLGAGEVCEVAVRDRLRFGEPACGALELNPVRMIGLEPREGVAVGVV